MKECGILAHAAKVAEQLEISDIPEGYDYSGYVPPTLADIRHNYSNYDELWRNLVEYCLDWTDDWRSDARCKFCYEMIDEYGTGDCELKDRAYQLIKNEVNYKISLLIQEKRSK